MDVTLVRWFVVWLVIWCCGWTHEAQFYKGCINETASWKKFNQDKPSLEPFSCVGLCIKKRYPFAAVQNGSSCYCNFSIASIGLNETECNIRCSSNPSLHCGGTSAQSAYSTAVPFIFSGSIASTPKAIQVNTSLTFEFSVLIRRPVNEVMNLQSLQENNKTLDNIYITWEINNNYLNHSIHSLNGNITLSSLSIHLKKPGIFRICASAKNLVSNLKHCSSLEVLLPVSGLHIVDINPKTQIFTSGKNSSLVAIKSLLYIKAAIDEGSNVTFVVTFGDNTKPLNASLNMYGPYSLSPTCITMWHTYSFCGNFSIFVTALNPFSIQSLPLIPVVAQERVLFASLYPVGALPGSSAKLVVDTIGGCELIYNWTFGDGSPSVISHVPEVFHIFNETKNYNIKVRIYNKIGSPYTVAGFVYIQNKVTNVTMSIKGGLQSQKNIFKTGTSIHFLVNSKPASEIGNTKYKWHVNHGYPDPTGSVHETDNQYYEKTFIFPERYLVYVVAINKVSNVTSKPISIIIEDPIKELKLKHKGKIILEEEIFFKASMTKGTNVTFIWDFGDGTVIKSTKTVISHVYHREKVYDVEVMAYNNVSQQNALLTLIVTKEDSCQPPTVQILGLQNIKINRFEEVYFESQVTLDCNETGVGVIYQWEIFLESSEGLNKLNNLTMYLSEPILIIPPYTLAYGHYVVKLKVYKEGTPELYSKVFLGLRVEKHRHLIANIKGGSMRVIGYKSKQNITFDGSGSLDPDYPEEKDQLRYKWECKSCFDPRVKLPLDQPVLTFPVQWLQEGKDSFFVTLNVSKHGYSDSNIWQTIRMVNAEPHLLTVHCPRCEQRLVNPSDPLVLQGFCLTCPWNDENLTFHWGLYFLNDKNDFSRDPECVLPVAQSVDDNHVESTAATIMLTRKSTVTLGTIPSRKATGTRAYKTSRPTEGMFENHDFRVENGNICSIPITLNPTVVPTKRCKYVPRKPSYGLGLMLHPATTPRYWLCPSNSEPFTHFKKHTNGYGSGTVGFTGPAGSVKGTASFPRTVSGHPTSETMPTSQTSITPSKSSGGKTPKSYYDPDYIVPTTELQADILRIDRVLVNFPDSWSATGKKHRNFILAPGKLKTGYKYMLALTVVDKFKTNQEYRRGMANVFFEVNKNPNIGRCSVGPVSGYEMETDFGFKCEQEIVENKLMYRVTCKIRGEREDEEMLLYTGSNEHPTFKLPAGKREHGYNVSVYISVFNYKRTTVKVCPVTVSVRPTRQTFQTMSTQDQLIKKTNEKIQALVKVGEEQKVKQLINIMIKALNRFNYSSNHHRHKRSKTRTEMLGIVKQFRVRDWGYAQGTGSEQVYTSEGTFMTDPTPEMTFLKAPYCSSEASAVQTGEAIDVITRVKNEVDIEGLSMASEMLSRVARQLKQSSRHERAQYSDRLVHLVTKLSSNLVAASSYLFNRSSNFTSNQDFTQKVLSKVLQIVIKTKLERLVLGEKPVRLSQPSLGVLVSKSLSLSQSKLELHDVSYHLPSDIATHLGMNSRSYLSACIGTVMVVYENNPYMWRNSQALHHTKVSSLDLSSCEGDVKAVKNLSQEIEISLPWVEDKDKDEQEEFKVKWKYLNIHTIKINNDMKNYSLQLKIQPLSKLTNSLKLKVLVSTNGDEKSLTQSKIYKSTSGGSVEFFFTSKQLKNSSGAVRVGVVVEDSAQNRIKKIFNVSPVNYSINSKWISCFYWDKTDNDWSTQGCRAIKTTQRTVNCRCNHLTLFGGASFLAPFTKSETFLGKSLSNKDKLIATVLVSCLVSLYLFLMFLCVRADRQDRRKEGVVDLTTATCRYPYRYKINVETGHWFGSGTTAGIMIRLHGENAASDAIELVGNDKPVFERGSKDVFLIKSPCDLSPLWKLHIWHYNQGDSPSWYLNRVIVKDMTTKEKWYFDCYRWLAVDEEDGRIDVELMSSPGMNESTLQWFYHSCVQYLVDYHLWLSVAGKPPQSRFSRAQRLTCCLSLLLSILWLNAAWYEVNKTDEINTNPLQLLGLLDITWQTLVCGIICSIIVLPVNLLWILIFRCSKPSSPMKKVHPSPLDDPITDTSNLPFTTGTPEEDTVSILDQTIETLLYLKNLGNKMKWQPSTLSERSSLDSSFGTSTSDNPSYISDPPVGDSLLDKKSTPSLSESKSAPHVPQCVHCKEHSCPSCYSESSIPSWPSRKKYELPHCFVYIGWIGCGMTILFGGFYTIWYGRSFDREESVWWLQSLCISLLESFFISQPFMVLVVLLFTLLSCYNLSLNKTELNDEEQDEGFQEFPSNYTNTAFDHTQNNLKEALEMKRHQRYLKFLKPLEKNVLSDACEKKQLKRTINSYFIEIFSSVVLMVLACLLVSSLYCGCSYDIKNAVQKTILSHSGDGTGVSHNTVGQWWNSNHKKIIELLYWRPTGLGLQNSTTPEMYFKDSQMVLIGRPRIRQFKTMKREICPPETNTSRNQSFDDGNSSVSHCWSTCATEQGRWSNIELSRTKSQAMETVQWLISDGWVTLCTQHIINEFVIYSASQDVFSTVTWKVTGLLSGAPNINILVNTWRGTLRDGAYDVFLKVSKFLFFVTYLLYLYHEFSTFLRMKKKYFKSVAKWLELSCLLISSVSIVVYVYWSVSMYTLFREMLTKLDDDVYSAGEVVYHSQELLITFYSLLMFVLILKFIHLLVVFKFMKRFSCLLSTTSNHLVALMILFLLFTLTFSHTGYLLFGRLHSEFKTFFRAFIYTSGRLSLHAQGHFLEAFNNGTPVFSILYLTLYIAGLFVMLRGLSIAIFKGFYHSSKRKHLPTHVVLEYLSNLYSRVFLAKTIVDESDESDEDSYLEDEIDGKQIIPVEYACDEVEFQMEELLFKLDNLAGIGGLKTNNLSYSSDVLSGDECEEDIEYLYRPNHPSILDHDVCGSGYDSDQSFFSSGSANQEGLTDLEKERKISKDSSTLTISETNSNEQPVCSLVKTDSQMVKVPAIQSSALTPNHLYRRHSENSELIQLHATELKVEHKNLQSSSGTSMTSRRPSLTNEYVKPRHLYPLTRKPKIRNGQMLLHNATVPCNLPKTLTTCVDDSTTSEENDDKKSTQTKTKTSKKHGYRRALGLFPKTAVAPMSNSTDLPSKVRDAFRTEVSSLSSPDASENRRSSSSSDDMQRLERTSLVCSAFVFDEDQPVGHPRDFIQPMTIDVPPLSPSEPGFGINSQDFYEAQDNLGFTMDSESSSTWADASKQATPLPGLIESICMNNDIGTNIESIDEERAETNTKDTRDI